jgi:hypothetical protein
LAIGNRKSAMISIDNAILPLSTLNVCVSLDRYSRL